LKGVSLKDGLEILYKLQQKDDQIKEIETIIKEIPLAVKKMEEERDGKVSIIEAAKAKLQENVKEREKLEKEIVVIREKINKYKDQMSKATTNREYQGFMAEIKYEEDNISTIEEKIIEKMLESDEIMKEIRERETEFNQIADEYNKKISDYKTTLAYNKAKLEEELKEKEAIRSQIPARLLRIYDNIFVNMGGKAVSYVEADFCGVCNVKIRPQRLNELISTNELFICENCGRILFKRVEEAEEAENPGSKDKKKK
jgi:hypothetical protein